MVEYAFADACRALSDDQYNNVLRHVMVALAKRDETLPTGLIEAIVADPGPWEEEIDLRMRVDFQAISRIGSQRDCRFFAVIAALQAEAYRKIPSIAPGAMTEEQAECGWAWISRWHDTLTAEAERLGRQLH